MSVPIRKKSLKIMTAAGSRQENILNISLHFRLCRMSSVSKMYRRRSSGRLATRKKRSVMSVTLRPALRTLAIVGVFFVCTGPTFITSLIYWVRLFRFDSENP